MKKLLLLIFLIPFFTISQSNLNAYKYVILDGDTHYSLENVLNEIGLQTLFSNETVPEELASNYCLSATVGFKYYRGGNGQVPAYFAELIFYNCNGNPVFSSKQRHQSSYDGAQIKVIRKLKSKLGYSFNPSLAKNSENNSIPNRFEQENKINLKSENSIREYFNNEGVDGIEGIWEFSGIDGSEYKLAILKDDNKYNVTILESNDMWRPGEEKATIETTASDKVVTVRWVMADKRTKVKTVGTVTNNYLIKFYLNKWEVVLYKVFPKFGSKSKTKPGEWAGNGSGIIISKSGYIVTNYHVIEDANDIEVEFILNDEVQRFNAEIVQVDKVNDLAIIKIFDMNFNGLDDLPYNFKSRSSDVGTKVYVYGYPMALSIMGKEIKITDGIISSKTGYDGNITTYQITAPIQGGNSGGPLFDDKGNFLGINSSGLRKDIADNVGYTIKSSYVLLLLKVLPKSIDLPSNTKLQSLPLTEQIKEISKYVVLIKVK
jgi:S1-C subfamily serine protease